MLKIAQSAEPSPQALAIELALTTGMRRGEVCGLRWSDIGDCEVTVNRTISLDGIFADEPEVPTFALSFTVEQLEIMLAEAKRKEAASMRHNE